MDAKTEAPCEHEPCAWPFCACDALAAPEWKAEPVAWVVPGGDDESRDGFIDAMCYQHGEFTRPLFASPPRADQDEIKRLREEIERALRSITYPVDTSIDADGFGVRPDQDVRYGVNVLLAALATKRSDAA